MSVGRAYTRSVAMERTRLVRSAVRRIGAWQQVGRISTDSQMGVRDDVRKARYRTTVRLGPAYSGNRRRAVNLAERLIAEARPALDVANPFTAVYVTPAPSGGHEGRIILLSHEPNVHMPADQVDAWAPWRVR